MTVALILALAVGVGAGIRRWWVLSLPVAIGGMTAVVMWLSGHGLQDTPIPFLVAAATVVMAAGVFLRARPAGIL